MVRELDQPSNGSQSEKSKNKVSKTKRQTAAKAGVPTWLAAGKGERDIERRRIEDIDEIDDVILWLKAIAAEEGPLFDSDRGPSSKETQAPAHSSEILKSFDSSSPGKHEDETKANPMIDKGGKAYSSPILATEISEKKKDDLISDIDHNEALPPWLNEVISFTDNLSINDEEADEDNVRSKQRAVKSTVAGGIMASLLFDDDDSHSLAYPEDKIMTERNEAEQEKPEDEKSFSDDEEWLEELSRKTIEELETAQTEGDADMEELGEIAAGEAVPDWLAADLQTEQEAGFAGVDSEAQSGAEEPSDTLRADEVGLDTASERVPDATPLGAMELQEDLDWLDHLADEDIQPVDVQTQDVTARSESTDLAALAAEIPEDPDEAIAWLEQLAVEEEGSDFLIEGVSLGGPEEPDASLIEPATPLKMPADENEAVQWLEEVVGTSLSRAPENQAQEMTAVAEAVTPQAPMDVALAKAEVERIMSEETEMLSDEGSDSSVSDESIQPANGEDQILDWLDDLDVTTDQVEVKGEVTFDEGLVSESVAVDEDTEVPRAEEDLGWLESIDLEEAAVTAQDLSEFEPTETQVEETVVTQLPEMIEEASTSIDPEVSESALEDLTSAGGDESELFSEAEMALKDGKIDKAVTNYKVILASKEYLPDLIAALESSVDQYQNQPALKRLLGDAYTENGQLQKALETYRKALEDI